jgi:hypothetical protein
MDLINLIPIMIALSAIGEPAPNATEWDFKEDISPKWVKDAEDYVSRAIRHMRFQADKSLWRQLGSSNPYFQPEWDKSNDTKRRLMTYLMVSDDDVCKATNVSKKLEYKLARNDDCTFKYKKSFSRKCQKSRPKKDKVQ